MKAFKALSKLSHFANAYIKTSWMLVFLLVVLILYFSWLPNPNIGSQPYFPNRLGKLINNYGNFRTAIPFVMLGALLEFRLSAISKFRSMRWIVLFAQALVVTLAEVGQLLLPMRHFDVMDIFWGIVGSIGGMLMAQTCKWLLSQ